MIDFVLTLNVVVFAVTAVTLYWRGYLTFYSGIFVYLAFHFVAFVQRPIAVHMFDLRSEFIYMQYMPPESIFLETILVANVGLFAFILGYLAVLRFEPIVPTFRIPPISPLEKKWLWISFWLLSPLIIYSFYLSIAAKIVYASEAFGVPERILLQVDPLTGATLFQDSTAYVVFARNMALPYASYFMIVSRARWYSVIPLALCAVISLQTGGRWEMVVSATVTVAIFLYTKGYLLLRPLHVVLFVPFLIIFMGMSQNRELISDFFSTGIFDLKFDLQNSSFGAHPDFANFEFLTYIVGKVPVDSGTWSYFTQYLGLFTQPIPRILWPDKPVVSPIMLVNLQEYGRFATRTTSLVGDGWMSLGYAGVIVTMGLAGAFYGWLYKRFCSPSVTIYFFIGYFWMEALLLQWARDGGYKITHFAFFCVGPICLAYLLKRFFSGSSTHDRWRPGSQLKSKIPGL